MCVYLYTVYNIYIYKESLNIVLLEKMGPVWYTFDYHLLMCFFWEDASFFIRQPVVKGWLYPNFHVKTHNFGTLKFTLW